jgi:hypothetical protein
MWMAKYCVELGVMRDLRYATSDNSLTLQGATLYSLPRYVTAETMPTSELGVVRGTQG